jgi:hypothetical protein
MITPPALVDLTPDLVTAREFDLSAVQPKEVFPRWFVGWVLLPVVVVGLWGVGLFALLTPWPSGGDLPGWTDGLVGALCVILAVLASISMAVFLWWRPTLRMLVHPEKLVFYQLGGRVVELPWSRAGSHIILLRTPDPRQPGGASLGLRTRETGGFPLTPESYEFVKGMVSATGSRFASEPLRPLFRTERLMIRLKNPTAESTLNT